jgi:hypothetical protein
VMLAVSLRSAPAADRFARYDHLRVSPPGPTGSSRPPPSPAVPRTPRHRSARTETIARRPAVPGGGDRNQSMGHLHHQRQGRKVTVLGRPIHQGLPMRMSAALPGAQSSLCGRSSWTFVSILPALPGRGSDPPSQEQDEQDDQNDKNDRADTYVHDVSSCKSECRSADPPRQQTLALPTVGPSKPAGAPLARNDSQ